MLSNRCASPWQANRMFTYEPAYVQSLAKLRELPASTWVFCGHEYTQSNAKFAKKIDHGNTALAQRAAHIDELRAQVCACRTRPYFGTCNSA